MPQNIDSILDAAEQREASDVFLQEDEVPRLKINEQISVLGDEPMSRAQLTAFWEACGANAQSDGDSDRDPAFVSRTHTRYRVSLHRTMGRLGAVLRRIKTKVPAFRQLRSPEWLLTGRCARRRMSVGTPTAGLTQRHERRCGRPSSVMSIFRSCAAGPVPSRSRSRQSQCRTSACRGRRALRRFRCAPFWARNWFPLQMV